MRPFSVADPAWFYIHVTCQTVGYALGVAGWATGLQLQKYNKGAIYYKHRNLGISIFVLATLQVRSLFPRASLFLLSIEEVKKNANHGD